MLHLKLDPGRDRAEVRVVASAVTDGVDDGVVAALPEGAFRRRVGVEACLDAEEFLVVALDDADDDDDGEAKFKVPMRSDFGL